MKEYDLFPIFQEIAKTVFNPIVLETGVKRSIPDRCTMWKHLVPHSKLYIGTDFEVGEDVDFIADLHTISKDIRKYPNIPQKYDIIISCATYEHIRNPFIVSKELYNLLNEGGLIFIHSVNCFPIHSFPFDYWRYTIEALEAVLVDAGFKIIDSAYQFPAKIESVESPTLINYPAYLNVCVIGKKYEDICIIL